MRGLQDSPSTDSLLRDTILRTFWLFQLCVSAPISCALGVSAFVRLVEVHGFIYDFIASLIPSLMAGVIVFILVIQRRMFEHGLSIDLTLKFEAVKSILATSLWIWELVDSGVQPTTVWNQRGPRMVAAGVSAIVLFLLFYPTVVYVTKEKQRQQKAVRVCVHEGESPELTRLLNV
ncbi:uncharacterized protein LTR77_007373 [Saxophila tyrrhenica]|uniref:Uncharacterized protein n=1 Tax=Saxophila tyrrhenica TaxID=1690608 RepID=A0AAV9P7G6_9PEZI|nr:hypothetical protein LTR77_007373 [Saxophila tyrrhenica]